MSCYCHRIHQTCSYCMAQFEAGEVVATTQIDHNGNHIEAFIPHSDPDGRPHHLFGNKIIQDQRNALDHTLQQAKARKIAERNKRLARELAHTYRPYSDPDGPPSCQFGNEKLAELQHSAINRELTHEHNLALAHRIPFAWRSKSIRDDLRMGTMALFGPTPEGDNS